MNLTELHLSYELDEGSLLNNNQFEGKLYVPSYIHTLGHAHNGVLCVCTVTEEEKMALKAKLPGCKIYF